MKQGFFNRQSFLAATITAGALLVAPGCGGDSSDGETIEVGANSLTKAEYIKRAGALCTQSKSQALRDHRQLVTEKGEANQSPAFEEQISGEIVNKVLVPIYENLIAELVQLGAPNGDQPEIDRMLNTLQRELHVAEEKPVETLNSLQSPFEGAAKVAKDYGMPACVEGLT